MVPRSTRHVSLKCVCECILVSRFVPKLFNKKKPSYVDLVFFTLAKAEKMKYEVIILRNEMRGGIAEYCFYQTLSIYLTI